VDRQQIGELLRQLLNRLVPVRTIEALIYEGIALTAVLVSYHLVHRLIISQVEEAWVRAALADVHGAFVIMYFVIFGFRLARTLLSTGDFHVLAVAA
jgi:hypothetical protein